jgi:hypothetical protein
VILYKARLISKSFSSNLSAKRKPIGTIAFRKFFVPDVLFTTIEPHAELPSVGKGCLIQARICRQKKECKGEINAKEISDVSI